VEALASVEASADHDGGDFFTILEFVECVLGDRQPPIDVYDAVTWSSMIPLAAESVQSGGGAVKFPQFKKHDPIGR